MRVRNKEIRNQRHRKEQIIKAAQRELRAQYGDKKATPVAKTVPKGTAPKKAAPKSAPKTAKPKE